MKGKAVFLFLVLFSLSFFLFSQSSQDLISQGDKLYTEMADMATAKKARENYQKAVQEAEDKYEVYWRLARIQYYIGSRLESKEAKKTVFQLGIDYAKKAIELEPDNAQYQHFLEEARKQR